MPQTRDQALRRIHANMIEQRNSKFAAIVLLIFVISIFKLVLHDYNFADISSESKGIRWQPIVYMAR